MEKIKEILTAVAGFGLVLFMLGGWVFVGPVMNLISGDNDAGQDSVQTELPNSETITPISNVDTEPEASSSYEPDYNYDYESVDYSDSVDYDYEAAAYAEDDECDPNYSPCVPNVSYDLDCPDIGFSVSVIGTDTNGFDRDNDGYGCESY